MPIDDKTASPVSAGKQMHEEPHRGHRQVTADEAREALGAKGSFDTGQKADAPPAHGMKPEDILSMDNIPDDPKEIERLLGTEFGDKSREDKPEGDAPAHRIAAAVESGDAVAFEAPAAAQAPAKDDKAKAPAAAAAAPAARADEGSFVESRDGKGKIPFAVLKHERQERADLARQLAEANTLIVQLRARPEPGEAASSGIEREQQEQAATDAAAGTLTAEQIEQIKANFPESLSEVIVRLNETAKLGLEAHGKIVDMEREAEQLETEERHTQAASVQDIIDQDEVLTKIQQDPQQWEEAVRIDTTLKSMRRWQGKPEVERFAEVKRMLGFEVEAAARPDKSPVPTAEELAAAKLQQAAGKQQQGRAFTHSDLPGGSAPAQSERESAAALSVHELGSRMEKMTSQQMERYLASIG